MIPLQKDRSIRNLYIRYMCNNVVYRLKQQFRKWQHFKNPEHYVSILVTLYKNRIVEKVQRIPLYSVLFHLIMKIPLNKLVIFEFHFPCTWTSEKTKEWTFESLHKRSINDNVCVLSRFHIWNYLNLDNSTSDSNGTKTN